MKAAIYHTYGTSDVLTIADLPDPVPAPDEILVRVCAAAVNPKDTFIRKGRFRLWTGNHFPKGTGFDFAGEVESVGNNVPGWQIGQHVYGMLDGWRGASCAEYVLVKAHQIASLPETIPFHQAGGLALVSLTALQALRDEAHLRDGQRVVVNGASGGVGSMAVQIAKTLADCHVTAIASTKHHDFLRELGADTCVDYHDTDITTGKQQFDVFFDVFGNQPFEKARRVLTSDGVWVSTVLKPHVLLSQFWTRLWGGQQARLVVVQSNSDDLAQIAGWVHEDRIQPVIDSTYPLSAIREAHERQQSKHARGKIIITMD